MALWTLTSGLALTMHLPQLLLWNSRLCPFGTMHLILAYARQAAPSSPKTQQPGGRQEEPCEPWESEPTAALQMAPSTPS